MCEIYTPQIMIARSRTERPNVLCAVLAASCVILLQSVVVRNSVASNSISPVRINLKYVAVLLQKKKK